MLHLNALNTANTADWKFCARWIIATTAAVALGNALDIVGFFSGPIVLAIAQWWALRAYWPHYRYGR
ncbi:MAG: hypothetical protein F6K00_00595 [Leptolyngbya sp. SIOISBB]|nr:hypothetical protein [Leptolyngbya sp. SIOISBB]